MTALLLAGALLLDAMVGEPKWLWSRLTHPVVLMGRLIDVLERRFNRGVARKAVGAGVLIVLVLVSACLGLALESVPLGPVFSLLLAAILLAQNSLGAVPDRAAARE
ncbi:MAG: cobalamin biosynthesis protein, partial [Pseudomonadota bacterium]